MSTTDIIPFATDPSANVESQAAYEADPQTATGFTSGIAKAEKLNKVWRQSSFIAAGIANFCVAQGVDVPDDGDLGALVTEIETALSNFIGSLIPSSFPAGTRIAFQQSAAPTGWTKDTTTAGMNDVLMRVTTGAVTSGGTQNFSTWNALAATGSTVLSSAQMPSHSHGVSDPGHEHTYGYTDIVGGGGTVPLDTGSTWFATAIAASTYKAGGGITTTGISVGSAGGGAGHTHPLTNGVKYFDFIVGVKN